MGEYLIANNDSSDLLERFSHYRLTSNVLSLCTVSEFVDFGDLHMFWQSKKKFDENTVRLLGAEIALALGTVIALFSITLSRYVATNIVDGN